MDQHLLKYAETHKSKRGVNWSEWKGSYGKDKCLRRLLILQNNKPRKQIFWTEEEE